MIFLHFDMVRSRTVYQNADPSLHKSELSIEERRKRIMSLPEPVGLMDKKNAYPS